MAISAKLPHPTPEQRSTLYELAPVVGAVHETVEDVAVVKLTEGEVGTSGSVSKDALVEEAVTILSPLRAIDLKVYVVFGVRTLVVVACSPLSGSHT